MDAKATAMAALVARTISALSPRPGRLDLSALTDDELEELVALAERYDVGGRADLSRLTARERARVEALAEKVRP
jgi:hypothetical protein